MSWKLTNGDSDFVTIHDECPTRLCELIMVIVDIYLDAISDPNAEPDCEDDLNDL